MEICIGIGLGSVQTLSNIITEPNSISFSLVLGLGLGVGLGQCRHTISLDNVIILVLQRDTVLSFSW